MNRKVRPAQGSTRSVHRETHRLQGRPHSSLKLDIAPLAQNKADGEAVVFVRSQHKGIAKKQNKEARFWRVCRGSP